MMVAWKGLSWGTEPLKLLRAYRCGNFEPEEQRHAVHIDFRFSSRGHDRRTAHYLRLQVRLRRTAPLRGRFLKKRANYVKIT